jgi:hypothetical protein
MEMSPGEMERKSGYMWVYLLVICYSLRTGKWPIEIVDLSIENGDVPQFFVCLPEGNVNIVAIIVNPTFINHMVY